MKKIFLVGVFAFATLGLYSCGNQEGVTETDADETVIERDTTVSELEVERTVVETDTVTETETIDTEENQ